MYKVLSISIFLFITSFNFANQTFNFSNKTYKQALKESKSNGKNIMLFFSLQNNDYCRNVEKKLFESSKTAELYQNNFINLKVNPKTKEGAMLTKKFNINAYPSIIFIDYKETIEHKIIGATADLDIIAIGKMVINGKGTLKYYNDLYSKDNSIFIKNTSLLLNYINTLYEAGENYDKKAELFFANINKSDMKNPKIVDAIIQYSENVYSPEFYYFAHNISNLQAQKHTSSDMFLKLENTISNQIISYLEKQPKANPIDTLNSLCDYLGVEQREQLESKVMIDYYSIVEKNKNLYLDALQRYIPLHLKYLSAEQIIDYCSEILESNDKEYINNATIWTENAMDIHPSIELAYTRVQLLIKAGRSDQAHDEIQRVYEIFKGHITTEWDKKFKALKLEESNKDAIQLKLVK